MAFTPMFLPQQKKVGQDTTLAPTSTFTPMFSSDGPQQVVTSFTPMFDGVSSPNVPENNPAKVNANMEARIRAVGKTPPPKKGIGNFLLKTLDYLNRPGYAVSNVIYDLTDRNPTNNNILGDIWGGLSGTIKKDYSDILKENYGWKDDTIGKKAVLLGADIAGGVLLDPLSFVSVGKLGADIADKVSNAAPWLKGLKGSLDDIYQAVGKTPGDIISDNDFTTAIENAAAVVREASDKARYATKVNAGYMGYMLPGVGDWLKRQTQEAADEFATNFARAYETGHKIASDPAISESALRNELIARITKRDPVALANPDISDSLSRMSKGQLSVALQFDDLYKGGVKTMHILTSAERLGDASKSEELVKKFVTTAQARIDTRKALEKAQSYVEYTNGLRTTFHDLKGTYTLSIMGKPVIEFSRGQRAVGKMASALYDKSPVVRAITDAIGNFNVHYLKRTEVAKFPKLVEGEREVTRAVRKESAIPFLSAGFADDYLSMVTGLPSNQRVRQNALYYIERNKDSIAAERWAEIMEKMQFTSHEMEMFEEVSKVLDSAHKAISSIDGEILGDGDEMYDIGTSYILHLLESKDPDFMAVVSRSKAERTAKALSTHHGSMKNRVFTSVAMAEKAGFKPKTTDVYDLLALRYMRSLRAQVHSEFTDAILKIPGLVSDTEQKGFVQLSQMIPGLAGKWVPPEFARHLERMDALYTNDQLLNQFLRTIYDPAVNFLKSLQTTANPSFTARNIIGEALMYYLDNPKASSLSKAMDVLRNKNILVAGNEISPNFIMNFFRTQGLGWAGVTSGDKTKEIGKLVDEVMRERGRNVPFRALKLVQSENPAAKALGKTLDVATKPVRWYMDKARSIGDYSETLFRLAHFIDKLEKGFDIETAADMVRAFHVDYRDISKFESNVMRRMIPYYTFMRKNIPMQLRLIAEKPYYPIAVSAVVRAFHNNLNNPEMSESLEESLAIPLWENDDGSISYLNINLPLADLSRFSNDLKDNSQEFISTLSPFIKAPFELATGRNISLDMPLTDYEGQETKPLFPRLAGSPRVPVPVDYAIQQMGFVNTLRNAVGNQPSNDSFKATNPEGIEKLFSSLLPRKHPDAMRAAKEYQRRDQLMAYMKKLEDEQGVKFPTTQELEKIEKLRQSGQFVPMFSIPPAASKVGKFQPMFMK